MDASQVCHAIVSAPAYDESMPPRGRHHNRKNGSRSSSNDPRASTS